ncbi:MAG TPA: HAD hydrolase family protein [Thermoleophilaceae bacterium]|nr:HAD hydrolase family protein [Thermoleophilaceae bacterium]
MALRCVYTDLDGTLLGRGASLFRDAEGDFTMLAARGLEACHRAGAEVVLKSGRRKAQVMEDARLIGQTAYIYEVGCGLSIEGEERYLTGDLQPTPERNVHEQIEDAGAPALLLEAYPGRLESHAPWHRAREFSHLMRGLVDADKANKLLVARGHENLRLVDNGVISRGETELDLEGRAHAYHLIPRTASKGRAVAEHMRARGYAPEECIGVGDSREDLGVAEFVGRFFVVANAVAREPDLLADAPVGARVEVTEGRNGEGFYEAVVRSLAEAR